MYLFNQRNCLQLILYGLLVTVLSVGCAGVRYETPDQVKQATKIIKDPYTNVIWITSPPVYNCVDGGIGGRCYFRTAFIDGKSAFYQLIVQYRGRDWLFLDTAYDIQNNKLELKVDDRIVTEGGGVKEIVVISLTDPYMVAQSMLNGLNIKIIGKRGHIIVKLPNGYVFGYVQRVETYMQEAGLLPAMAEIKAAITEIVAKGQKELEDKVKGRGKVGINVAMKRIISMSPGSPAEVAGIRVDDIILKADGQELNGDPLHDAMLITGEPGSKVELLILRGEERLTLMVTRGNP